MIKLKFVGNKPLITAKGVSFSASKLDKYEYIEPAAHLLEIFLELGENHKQAAIDPSLVYGEDKILEILKKTRPDIEKFYEAKIKEYKQHLEEEKEEVNSEQNLSDEEKRTLKSNYKFMEEYRIQRSTNKLVYEEIVNSCVEIILKKQITDIKAPFSVTFLHVLGSLETTLRQQKNPPRTIELTAKLDSETPYSSMNIAF